MVDLSETPARVTSGGHDSPEVVQKPARRLAVPVGVTIAVAVRFDVASAGALRVGAGRPTGTNPVKDLSSDEFVILENGTPRPVTAFAFVDIPITAGHGPVEQWAVRPDVVANDGPEGRLYLIALDEVAPGNALRARHFLRRFLEQQFQPNDMAVVVLTGRGLVTDGQPFTSDPRLVLAAVDKFSGGFLAGPECDAAWQFTTGSSTRTLPMPRSNTSDPLIRNRLAQLRQLTEQLAQMPGGRKTVLYFTECIGFDMFDALEYAGGVLSLAGEEAHGAMVAATRGLVVVYPIDPAGLTAEGGTSGLNDRMDLAALAGATGGFSLTNSNSFDAAFTRVVQEASSYYVLGFTPAYDRRDGRYVRLEVQVTRPRLRVRARDGYLAPKGGSPSEREPAGAPPAIATALATPAPMRGVPMRLFAAPFKGPNRDAAVALAMEIDMAAVAFVEQDGVDRGTLEVSYTATDARNRAYPGARHAISLTRPPGTEAAPAEGRPLRILSQLALPAGRYQIRVAAGSAARAGSVLYDLEVPDFTRAPLVLSGLALTSLSAGAVPTLRPAPGRGGGRAVNCRPPSCVVPLSDGAPSEHDPLGDALPAPPTTAREFDRTDTLALFVEVYTNLRRPSAHTVSLTTSLRRMDGEVVAAVTEERPSEAPRRPSGGQGFTAQVPLQDVEPGPYLLHVEARSDAAPDAAVERAVPIVVR
jgi:VWFA-related protein